jgi:tetratricopeptide (TPR) repeat protein
MKPRAFVGSSVEGLPVAYAVQQNLLHDAEITVWDQGVFELSATTIESLTKAISSTDFGIFVFSPDDTVRMRGNEAKSVRDNVLFELGLFIGKLGRDRVFFLIPSTSPPLIPSDLVGITPAKYETSRTDGSMQAATGPACHQIRQAIGSLGPLNPLEGNLSPTGESEKSEAETLDWSKDFIAARFADAKTKLEASLLEADADDALWTGVWINYCDFKLHENVGIDRLVAYAEDHRASLAVQELTAAILRTEREPERAIRLLDSVDPAIRNTPGIAIALSECYVATEEREKAVALLSDSHVITDPDAALALADLYESDGALVEAQHVIHDAHILNPRHLELRFKYARLAQELEQHSVAAHLLDELASENQDTVEYWGYLGNSCLSLGFYDRALYAYRRAESLLDENSDQGWIVSNIGNLLNNKELPTEAVSYFERAIKVDPESVYAHDRLAKALKKRADEMKKYTMKMAEGRKIVRGFAAERRLAAESLPDEAS